MSDLEHTVNRMKIMYREIFMKTSDAIQLRIDEIKPKDFQGDILDKYEENSKGFQWQIAVLDMFENDYIFLCPAFIYQCAFIFLF